MLCLGDNILFTGRGGGGCRGAEVSRGARVTMGPKTTLQGGGEGRGIGVNNTAQAQDEESSQPNDTIREVKNMEFDTSVNTTLGSAATLCQDVILNTGTPNSSSTSVPVKDIKLAAALNAGVKLLRSMRVSKIAYAAMLENQIFFMAL